MTATTRSRATKRPSQPARPLDQFAADRRYSPGRSCWFCKLPEDVRAEVDRHLSARTASHRVILEWLHEEHGFAEATAGKLEGHLRNGHVPGYVRSRS